jgi:malate dehydrogenase
VGDHGRPLGRLLRHPTGIVFGFPCECKGGSYTIIQGIEIDDYSREKINKTLKELTDEAEAVQGML